MNKPLVSIIIPTYNRGKLIGDTLQSIVNQSYKNWECIVVDDGSTDETCILLEEYCFNDNRFSFYQRPKERKKGANACRNYGLELSKGLFINFFDSDDLMAPNMLELKMKAINGYDFSYCNCLFFKDEDLSDTWNYKIETDNDLLSAYISNELIFTPPISLWRKSCLKNNRFNEDLSRAQELDFYSRLLFNNNFKGNKINENLVFIREHSNSITGSYNNGDKNKIKDDLKVRKFIWLKSQEKLSTKTQQKTFNLFLYTVKITLRNKLFFFLFYHLIISFFKTKFKFKYTILKLIGISFLFLLTNKGLMQLKKIINKHLSYE